MNLQNLDSEFHTQCKHLLAESQLAQSFDTVLLAALYKNNLRMERGLTADGFQLLEHLLC